jgi:cysteine synthase A
VFDAWRDGSMQQRLKQHDVAYDVDAEVDPYTLLPKWLHPRKTA